MSVGKLEGALVVGVPIADADGVAAQVEIRLRAVGPERDAWVGPNT